MPFRKRAYTRFPVQCAVTYYPSIKVGHGTASNLSLNGWRLSGDVALRVGQTFSMSVNLPSQGNLFVATVIVRWVHNSECGLENLLVSKEVQSRIRDYIRQLTQERGSSS
jgi:hypothetical protein